MKKLLIMIASVILIYPAVSLGKEQPLWEIGLGLSAFYLPDYRGSDVSREHFFPIPYFTYRGEIVKAERSNVKGRIFETERLKLDISLGGGVSVDSENNEARKGMPDLDMTGELGPSLELNLWKRTSGSGSLWFKLPFRGVFSFDRSDLSYRGLKFAPVFNYRWRSRLLKNLALSLTLGPYFSSQKYHDYFYAIEPGFATLARPEFHPEGGYGGSRVSLVARKRFENLWIGTFARYDTLSHAGFKNSPLVKTNEYLAVGIVVAWMALKSKKNVNTR